MLLYCFFLQLSMAAQALETIYRVIAICSCKHFDDCQRYTGALNSRASCTVHLWTDGHEPALITPLVMKLVCVELMKLSFFRPYRLSSQRSTWSHIQTAPVTWTCRSSGVGLKWSGQHHTHTRTQKGIYADTNRGNMPPSHVSLWQLKQYDVGFFCIVAAVTWNLIQRVIALCNMHVSGVAMLL